MHKCAVSGQQGVFPEGVLMLDTLVLLGSDIQKWE